MVVKLEQSCSSRLVAGVELLQGASWYHTSHGGMRF
jgi:hypothetical protein